METKTKTKSKREPKHEYCELSDRTIDEYENFDVSSEDYKQISEKVKRKFDSGGPKIYWTSDTEKYIEEYIMAETQTKRNRIYEDHLKFSFEKMAENIINTYKFEYFETDKKDAQNECISHMISNIEKFDPIQYKGRSFGYFSVMTKNFFILLNNSNHKKWKNHETIDQSPDEEYRVKKDFFVDDHAKLKANDKKEFVKLMIRFWEENIDKIFTKRSEMKIANSILNIFRFGDVDIYNKKYIYFCIKEMCNCKTQQLTKVINKMKKYQKLLTSDYVSHGCLGKTIRPPDDYNIDETEDYEKILRDGKSI
jgi:hypothetical protein